MRSVTLLFLSVFVIAATGCISKGRHQREISGLQTQATTLTSQVAEMDSALRTEQEKSRTLEAQLEALRGQKQAGGGAASGYGMYRTPSGFELPAADIQKALKGAGYYAGTIDGQIGPDSREALRNFQRGNGLTADGVCGRQTWGKLKNYLDVLK